MSAPVPVPWYIPAAQLDIWRRREAFKVEPPKTAEQHQQLLVDTVYLSRNNPAFFIHEFMEIRTKAGGRMPFNVWTPAQRKFYLAVLRQYASGRPVRAIILKARQMGISTLCEALLYWRTALFPDATTLIVAHEEDAVSNIFSMFRLYYDSTPEALRQPTDKFNKGEISFDVPVAKRGTGEQGLGSRVIVKTAALGGTSKATSGKGRSATYHGIHASEAAFWAEPERFWGGVQQGVPDVQHTWVFVESTANGSGNWFHQFWRQAALGWAMSGGPDGKVGWRCTDPSLARSGYLPVFLSWLEHPEYCDDPGFDVEDPQALARWKKDLDKEERKLIKHLGATPGQIAWRRRVLFDKCAGDLHLFHQEYPSTPDEAFITSGRKVFDMVALASYEDAILVEQRHCRPARGDYDVSPALDGDGWTWAWQQADGDGPVSVFVEPVPGREYVIGVDACYGKQNGDYACAQVLDRASWEQVAIAHGRLDPDQMAHLVFGLASHFNEALTVVEIDGPGIHTLQKLQELGHWNLYRRFAFDGVSKKPQSAWGWKMSTKSRAHMVGGLKAAIREREIVLHDLATISEMQNWALALQSGTGKAKERPEGPDGYDDRITSLGIALVGGILQGGMGGIIASQKVGNEEGKPKSPFGLLLPTDIASEGHPVLGTTY